ncbi:uncharacterized protein LOC129919481 [Episyrphus balteatus]|uniref:uncharacterized protein LOC129919481 n=1 Tax=Episyrphus balteatus TaxID=286459 RepID=UPI0024867F79|nr:uncharacterized protein LOC129919481 [Episyrphus balteatus]
MNVQAAIIAAFVAVFAAQFLTTEARFYSKSTKKSSFDDEFIRDLTTSLAIPVILLTETSSFYLSGEFNENILTIVQIDSSELILQKLSEHLQHLRFCKTIFVLSSSSRNDFALKRVFTFCWKHRMVNVIAVFHDFWNSSTFYSYRNLRDLTIEKFIWNKKKIVIFPNRMNNLQGIQFPVLFERVDSGVIIKVNSKGEPIFGGFMGNIFSSFAEKINARLDMSNVNTSLPPYSAHELVLNGTIEMSNSEMMLLPIKWHSYPIAMFDWSVMVPVESTVPIYKVFAFVCNWDAFAISILVLILLSVSLTATNRFSGSSYDFFFNTDCFRGMLGQSLPQAPQASCSTKIIYSLIFLFGIMMVTSFNAFLQSFMTQPPRERIIKSFDDLQESGLKILLHKVDIDNLFKMRPNLMKKYSNLFQIETNYVALKELRNSLNTNYAFAVTGISWMNYENQQNFFNRKLFRWSEEMCFVKNRLMGILMNENSIYKKILNFHILEIQSSGLLDFWMKKSFFELLGTGQIKKLDIDFDSKLQSLRVEDLKWIFKLMGLSLAVAAISFIGEFVFSNGNKFAGCFRK